MNIFVISKFPWLFAVALGVRKVNAMDAVHLGRILKGSSCGDPAFDQLSLDVLLGFVDGFWMLMDVHIYGYDMT